MKNIIQCPDGVYRWGYDLNLYKNPTILFLLWKIFGGIVAGMWLFIGLLSMGDHGFWWDGFWDHTKFFAVFLVGFLLLCAVGYFIYALIMGGKYCVLFEMDEKGVRHTQAPRQVKKAQLMSAITAFTGAAAGSLGAVGIGLMSGAKNSMYSDFGSVRSVRAYPKRNVIKVNALMSKNQVYAEQEDFDFVLDYIRTRCVKIKKA